MYVRAQDAAPRELGNPSDAMETFQRRSTECLIMSNYSTAPGSFTLEALLLNIQGEFVLRPRAPVGVWILSSIVTRLAMRMGYHRDPEHYPQISPFNREMRRRVWAAILQLDTLSSYQLGLPAIMQESQYDTRPPGNFFDDDLDPDAAELPQARPETELTPVLYVIAKGRLLSVFRSIFNQPPSVRRIAYEEIMASDQRLRAAHALIPSRLRHARLEDSIMVSSTLLIQQYNLELLFQKTRCILHRHHMTEYYQNPKYAYSRSSCIQAAMTLLAHQARIFEEVQVGGRLYKDKWFLSTLEQNDFLLAAMIVCLELKSRAHEYSEASSDAKEPGVCEFSHEGMISALQKARGFWDEFRTSSAEAQQASIFLGVILGRISLRSEMQNDHSSGPSLYSHEARSLAEESTLAGTGWLSIFNVY
jgi:hypothetical protein